MNYTLVLYKSDGCNTCRGCVMEQWGSDFSLDANVSEADAIEKIAEAFSRPSEGGSYTAHLIGIVESKYDKYDMLTQTEQVVYEFSQYTGADWQQNVGGVTIASSNNEAYWDEIESEGNRINKLIRNRVTELLEAQRLANEKAKQKEQEKEAKEKELYERQQLAALQKKYAKE